MGDRGPHSAEIRHMAEQEKDHRAKFDALLVKRGVRPTALHPFWSAAGYALGAGTALLGPEAAMACTAAVETEIDKHYSEQLDRLVDSGRRSRTGRNDRGFFARMNASTAMPRSPTARNARRPIRCSPAQSGWAAALRSR